MYWIVKRSGKYFTQCTTKYYEVILFFFPFLGKNITVYKIILLKVKIQYFAFFSKQIYVQYTFFILFSFFFVQI